jgi:hypothetical protein
MPACISFSALFPCISKKPQDSKFKGQKTLSDPEDDSAQLDSKKKSVTFKKDATVTANDKDTQEFLYSSAEQKDVLYRLRGDIGVVLGASASQSPSDENKSDVDDPTASKLTATSVDLRPSPPQLSMFEPRSSPHTIFSGQSNSPHSSSTSMFAPGGPCDSPVLSPSAAQRPQHSDIVNCGSIEWYNEQDRSNQQLANGNPPNHVSGDVVNAPHLRSNQDATRLGPEKTSNGSALAQRSSVDPSRTPARPSTSMGSPPIPSKQSTNGNGPPAAGENRFSTPPHPSAAVARRVASGSPAAPAAANSSPAISAASVAAASVAAAAVAGKRTFSPSVSAMAAQSAAPRPPADVPMSSVQSWMQLDPNAQPAGNAATPGKTPYYTAPPPRSSAATVTPLGSSGHRAEPRAQVLVRDNDDRCKVCNLTAH